ncbi:MAG: MBL fold metallo-hydrolase [Phycisphaerae bacterium]|nr:MBL fold metallo-hydrolase [Phycisphaerae bacterium]
MNKNIILKRFHVGRYPINGYLLADAKTHIGAFIDPGGFSGLIEKYINDHNINLRYLLFTHGHWDHIEGLEDFTKKYSVMCCAGPGELRAASKILHGGETIELGTLPVKTISVPGHTSGHVAFLAHNCLFTGDCLFNGSLGFTNGHNNARMQKNHIHDNLLCLPDHTLVFPAHGPISTIADEKNNNPFLQKN